jgi:allantoin racemase
LSFEDVMTGFDRPGKVVDQFRKTAQQLVDAGAHAIIPGEMPLNLLLDRWWCVK